MKKILTRWAVVSALLIPVLIPAYSQSSSKKKSDDLEFVDRLWVGGMGTTSLQFGGGNFAFGLAPMAGYELVPKLSIGPFVRLDYHYERLSAGRPYFRYESFDVGPGIFTRFDAFRSFFAQVEYEHAFVQVPLTDNAGNILFDNDRKALKETEVQNYVYVGAGYASGDNVRYGFSIHYNVLDDFNYIRIPWDYRLNLRVNIGK